MTENIQRMADMFTEGAFTKKEALAFLKQITEFVKNLESKKDREMESLKTAVKNITDKLASDSTTSHDKLRKEVDGLFVGEKMTAMEKKHAEMMGAADGKVKSLKHGRDGMPGANGFPGKDGRLINPDEVVNKVNQANALIRTDKVEGLPELLEKVDLATKQESRRILAGPNANAVQIANVSSQATGSNRIFYVPKARYYHIMFSHQAPFFYFPTTHFTIGNGSITLLNNIEAPQTGQSLGIFYTK